MFKFARKHSKALWVKIMYTLIALSFLIGFAVFIGSGITTYVKTGGLSPNIVAEVNGKQITLREFERTLRNLKEGADEPYIRELILMQLVNRLLLMEIAKSYGFTVSDSELAEHIASLKYFQDNNGNFNQKIYYTLLRQNNITPKDFEEGLREEILIKEFQNFIKDLITPTEEDLWWYYRSKNETANFYVAKIDPERFESTIKIKDSELREYYEGHKDEFKGSTQKGFSYILFSLGSYMSKIQIPEEEISSYYKEHRKEFLLGSGAQKRLRGLNEVREDIVKKLKEKKAEEIARKDAEEAREMLNRGESMEDVAKKFGAELKTVGPVDEGGIKNLPLVGEALSEVFNTLDEGKISEVKRFDKGFLITKITSTKEGAPLQFEEAKGRIAKILKNKYAKELIKKEAESLSRQIRAQKDPVRFLESRGYKVEETGNITINTSFIKGIGFAPGFLKVSEKLNLRNRFPDAPYEFLGNYYIYWLKDKKSADKGEFEKSIDKVREEYLEEETQKKIQELILNARKTANIKMNKELFAGETKKSPAGNIPFNSLF